MFIFVDCILLWLFCYWIIDWFKWVEFRFIEHKLNWYVNCYLYENILLNWHLIFILGEFMLTCIYTLEYNDLRYLWQFASFLILIWLMLKWIVKYKIKVKYSFWELLVSSFSLSMFNYFNSKLVIMVECEKLFRCIFVWTYNFELSSWRI